VEFFLGAVAGAVVFFVVLGLTPERFKTKAVLFLGGAGLLLGVYSYFFY